METTPTLLIVDDEVEILGFLERMLSSQYAILKAENGRQALQILSAKPVHLIVSDVMMPETDGFELCKIIKSTVEYSHIPVILLTAKNTIQAKVEGLELGADVYIEKPFSQEHLQAQIKSLLANRAMMVHYFASSPLGHIKSMAHTKADERFLENLNKVINDNMSEIEFDLDQMAEQMNMSRMTLYRKVKAISDLSPLELMNVTRLKKAAELLAEGGYMIYQIADLVGFGTQSNFARSFHKQFGMTPTEFMHSKHS